jgi:hypothetical protein
MTQVPKPLTLPADEEDSIRGFNMPFGIVSNHNPEGKKQYSTVFVDFNPHGMNFPQEVIKNQVMMLGIIHSACHSGPWEIRVFEHPPHFYGGQNQFFQTYFRSGQGIVYALVGVRFAFKTWYTAVPMAVSEPPTSDTSQSPTEFVAKLPMVYLTSAEFIREAMVDTGIEFKKIEEEIRRCIAEVMPHLVREMVPRIKVTFE